MPPEAKVKRKVTAILKKHGAWYIFPIPGPGTPTGTPDLICLSKSGKPFAVEAKAGKGKCTAKQLLEQKILAIRNVHTLVINERNLNELDEFLVNLQ